MEAESTGSLWNGIVENGGGEVMTAKSRIGVAEKGEEKEKHRKALLHIAKVMRWIARQRKNKE